MADGHTIDGRRPFVTPGRFICLSQLRPSYHYCCPYLTGLVPFGQPISNTNISKIHYLYLVLLLLLLSTTVLANLFYNLFYVSIGKHMNGFIFTVCVSE